MAHFVLLSYILYMVLLKKTIHFIVYGCFHTAPLNKVHSKCICISSWHASVRHEHVTHKYA